MKDIMEKEEEKKNVVLNDEELKEVAGGKIFSGPCWKKKNKLDCEREIACFWTIYNQCIKNI
jgi:hypothetical protein